MAINMKFDLANNPEPPTIILATRNGQKLGQLDIDAKSIDLSDKLNDASEITFTLNKYVNEKVTNLWDKVVDFKLVYCKEWDMWFEISVELDEETETVKTVFCTQLGQAELSQIMLYNIEINTEDDIARDDYILPTVLYRKNGVKNEGITEEEADKLEKLGIELPYEDYKECSLLHRLLKDKAPHYSIIHVDSSIEKIQRMFSFDDDSIYDAFEEISEEIGCLFDFHSNSDENGNIQRAISVYDLQQSCKDCGYRGEHFEECPKCGSPNIADGYGEDTTIFVTSDELASGGINLTTDTDSVKNCFKLEAGDDLMTATIRNCNPNGTDYIWYLSDTLKEDMSSELVDKINAYDELYNMYQNRYESSLNEELVNEYNALVRKYRVYNEELEEVQLPIIGYPSLMNAYYNTIDLYVYLQSALMPDVAKSDTDAQKEAAKLTAENLSPVSTNNVDYISVDTATNIILSRARLLVNSRYKVKEESSSLDEKTKIWTGSFKVVNYYDEEDVAISAIIEVAINDDYSSFIQQTVEKSLKKDDSDDLSISGLFEKSYDDFVLELKKYSLNCLTSFKNSCQSCIDILIDQGIADDKTWSGQDPNLYEDLYEPYLKKSTAIDAEIKIRREEINSIIGVYDENNDLQTYGLQNYITDIKADIQSQLDFQNYLENDDLWLEFCAFRRECKYSNDNYISEGLDNAKLFENALEFFEVANNEIYKSAELQHSIDATLKNLLLIDKFKSLVKYFKVGNWIRIRIDDAIYKLRLIEYDVSYNSLEDIQVVFSDVLKVKSGILKGVNDVQSIISQASSMSKSYESVKRQAGQGAKSNNILNTWFDDGLSATKTKIIGGADDETQVWDEHGLLLRKLNIDGTYDDTQLKIINSTIAITDDNWNTTKTAIGNFYYIDPVTGERKSAYGVNGEVIIGKLIIGEGLGIYNDSGSLTFNDDGLIVSNGVNTVSIDPNDASVLNVKSQDGNVLSFDEDGNLVIVGNITAKSLTLMDGAAVDLGHINGLSDVAISGDYEDLKNKPTDVSYFNNDAGYLTEDDLENCTPVRGVDYWTDEDKAEIVNSVLEELRNQGIIS